MKDDVIIRAYVTNLGMYNEGYFVGEWVDFPINHEGIGVKQVLDEMLCRIGIDNVHYEEYFITDYDCEIKGLSDCFGEYENLLLLHYLACKIKEIENKELFESMIAHGEMTGSVTELINLAANEESFYFMPEVENDYDLGYEYAKNSGLFTEALDSLGMLANYIDYESYGRDIRFIEGGQHTKNGYISLTDAIQIVFDSSTDNVPSAYL